MKEALKKILRTLMRPLHHRYTKRNGVTSQAQRREMPNAILLGLARDVIRDGHTAIINVKGYSMRPFLEHCRDKVKLAPPHELKVGDAILAEISPDHYVLHRIIRLEGDNITLMGDGNIRGQEHCTRKDVAGIVIEYIRPNRVIPASDPKLIRHIRLWRRLLPIRRWLLVLYNAIVG